MSTSLPTATATAASRGDDIPQRTQTAVDARCLFRPRTLCSRLLQSFRPSQIDEIEDAFAALAGSGAGAAQREHED